MSETLLTTPLDGLHRELGGKMVPFAGYAMPVRYPAGIMAEHRHVREQAGLFDVSHMGQVEIKGPGVAAWLETLVPGDIQGLKAGRTRYSVFTNAEGGILDDLMISKLAEDHLFLVVNAACKSADIAHMRAHLAPRLDVGSAGIPRPAGHSRPHGGQGGRRLVPGLGGDGLHVDRSLDHRGHRLFGDPFGLYRRGRVRDFGPRRSGRSPGPRPSGDRGRQADRLGRARFPAFGSRVVSVRLGHHHPDHPGRGRYRLDHRQAPPRTGRFPRRRKNLGAIGPRPGAPARRRPPERPRPRPAPIPR